MPIKLLVLKNLIVIPSPPTDISQMAPKRRPIEGKIAVWDGIAQPDFGVLALSAAP